MKARRRIGSRAVVRTFALSTLAAVLLGSACNNQPHEAHLSFDPASLSAGIGGIVDVDVVVDVSQGALQAFELSFQVTPSTAAWIAEARPSEFDDDGALFVNPVSDFLAGTIGPVVDLRHGDDSARGVVRLTRLRIVPLEAGPATLSISSAGLSGSEGQSFDLTLDSLELDISP